MIYLKFKALAASVCVTLAACGGGGSEAPATSSAQSACKPLAVVRVQLFGDSTMVNLDAFTNGALQKAMDARFGAGVVAIQNRAMPGTDSSQLMSGGDGLNLPWPQSLAADIVVINHGLNDYGRHDLAAYQTNLRAVGSSGVPVLFMTPNASTVQQMSGHAGTMTATAQSLGSPVADVYAYFAAQANWPAMLMADGVHPLPAAEALIVRDVVAPALVKMVAPLRCE